MCRGPPSSKIFNINHARSQGVRLVRWNTTSPRRNRPENSFNYSHYLPSNSRNFIDYPPSKSGRKTPSTTPLSNSRNFIDYPPRNRAEKLLQLRPCKWLLYRGPRVPSYATACNRRSWVVLIINIWRTGYKLWVRFINRT